MTKDLLLKRLRTNAIIFYKTSRTEAKLSEDEKRAVLEIRRKMRIARGEDPNEAPDEDDIVKYDPAAVRSALVQKLKDGNSSFVEFRFENAKLLHDAEFFLCQNGGVFEAAHMAERDSAQFSHSKINDMNLLRVSFE